MKIYPFQAIYPEFKLVASTDSFIKSVKTQFEKYRTNGFFKRAAQEAFYIHEIEKDGRKYRGLIAAVDIENYISEKILIHEKTIASKEQITMELLLDRNAMIKPILVAFENTKSLDTIFNNVLSSQKPFYQTKFEDQNIYHRFYQIADSKAIEKISLQFAKIPQAYLADGHHRRQVVINLINSGQIGDKNSTRQTLLTALFPFSDLMIHDFNRLADVFDICSPTHFIIKLTKYFKLKNLKKPTRPSKKFEIIAYMNGEWIGLKWKKSILNKHKTSPILLDAELLDTYVFKEILEVKDISLTSRIKYIEGVKPQIDVVNQVNADFKKVAFFIYPVQKEELKKVAEDKLSLPPKSTWFEPRLKNGLIAAEL